jgi:hypothetical protein
MFLRGHDVQAIVVGDYVNAILGPASPKMLQVELMLLEPAQRDLAGQLLEEFDSAPIELDADWERQAEPELHHIELACFDLRCTGCLYDLAGLSQSGVCPECGGEYDFLALIVARHGPEALEAIFGSAPDMSNFARRRFCKECSEDITSLPVRGRCPQCGKLFDKELE